MQILFLTHRLPYPPDKGERIRAFHELKYLAARHDVDLFCFADSKEDVEHQAACQSLCRSVYAEVLTKPVRLLRAAQAGICGKSMSSAFFYSSRLAMKVRLALRNHKYDLIFVYCSSMGQFIPLTNSAPIVADFVDADSAKWIQYARSSGPPKSFVYAHEARAVATSEQELLKRAALSLVTTAHDASELGGADAGRLPVEVMANGVEIPESFPGASDARIRELQPFALFVGTMDYKPNSDAADHFARDIFPQIRRRHPQLNFVIVGRNPDNKVRRLAALPGVTVTGSVPDVYKYFRLADVSVAPFRLSQGFHNKIAESLAVGTPVVTSGRAAAGIGLSEKEGLFATDTQDQFVEMVDFVLNNSSLRNQFRASAANIRKLLSWEMQLRKLEVMIDQVVSKSNSYANAAHCQQVLL